MATSANIGLMSLVRPGHAGRLAAALRTAEILTDLLGTLELAPPLRLALEAAIRDVTLALPLSRSIRTYLREFVRTAVANGDARGIHDAASRFRVTEIAEITGRVIINLEDARRRGVSPELDAARYLTVLYEVHAIWTDVEGHLVRGHRVIQERHSGSPR